MINTVIFDLDDTLYDFETPNEPAVQRMCAAAEKDLGIPAEEFRAAYESSFDELRDITGLGADVAAMHERTLRIQNALEKFNKPLFPYVLKYYHMYWGYLMANIKPEPGIVELLQALKERGIRIGIGTNLTAMVQFAKLETLELTDYIDFVVTSDEVVFDKPAERFFERCIEKAECKAEECLFIGDNYALDFEGATSAGMKAIWYNSKHRPEYGCRYVVHSHFELLDMIGR